MSDSQLVLRHRMKIADDLRSVVKTMKAMAAASVTQYEQAAEALQDYNRTVELCLALYLSKHRSDFSSSQLLNASGAENSHAVLIFGTDQGMVGQFNESLASTISSRLTSDSTSPIIWAVGERIQYRLENAGYPVARSFRTPESIDAVTGLITKILEAIDWAWITGEIASVSYCRNAPLNRSNYESRWDQLLPLDHKWERRIREIQWPTARLPELIGEEESTFPAFVSEFLFVSLFKACTESLAAENGARLAAMQRAESNIDDRLREFRFDFNRARQNSIDEELFDLQAGFETLMKESCDK